MKTLIYAFRISSILFITFTVIYFLQFLAGHNNNDTWILLVPLLLVSLFSVWIYIWLNYTIYLIKRATRKKIQSLTTSKKTIVEVLLTYESAKNKWTLNKDDEETFYKITSMLKYFFDDWKMPGGIVDIRDMWEWFYRIKDFKDNTITI